MKFRHVGIVTADLDQSLNFWLSLGYVVVNDSIEPHPFIDLLLGDNVGDLRTVKLTSQSHVVQAPELELLEFQRKIYGSSQTVASVGISHFAIEVSNAESMCALAIKNGAEMISTGGVQNSPNGLVKVAYLKTPDGHFLEIVQEMNAHGVGEQKI